MRDDIIKNVEKTALHTVDVAVHGIGAVESTLEAKVKPLRQSVLSRFPTLFILLTTFGVTSVLFGLEGIIAQVPFLADRPWLILLTGIGVLAFTGTLFTKLGTK